MYEVNPVDLTEHFVIQVFNNNINDARNVSLGLTYKNMNIDYFSTYIEQNDLGADSKIMIPSRDSINLRIKTSELGTIIRDVNQGSTRVKRINTFVIDSLGITTEVKAKKVKKNTKKIIHKQIKEEKQTKKTELLKIKLEKKQIRKAHKEIKKAQRKEKWASIKIRIISKVKKNK